MTTEQEKKKPSCPICGKEFTFDKNHVSKNGRMIPLEADTKQPHPFHTDEEKAEHERKKAAEELKEINGATAPLTETKTSEVLEPLMETDKQKKLEGIAASIHSVSRLKIFTITDLHSEKQIEKLYGEFMDKIRLLGCTPKGTPSLIQGAHITIFIYFECPLEFKEEVQKLYE